MEESAFHGGKKEHVSNALKIKARKATKMDLSRPFFKDLLNLQWKWAAILSIIVLLTLCGAKQTQAYPMESHSQHPNRGAEVENWADTRNIDLLRYLWEVKRLRDHTNRLAVAENHPERQQQNYKRANTNCLFHAGLAHNCDYRDVIASVNEMSYWGSDLAPGKRKKKRTVPYPI